MSHAAVVIAAAALVAGCRTAGESIRPQVVLVQWTSGGESSTPQRVVGIDELPRIWTQVARANDDEWSAGFLSHYGSSIANVGDVEGCGADDLLVAGRNSKFEEAVDLLAGEARADWGRVRATFEANGYRGVAALGDVDRDGRPDFAEIAYDDSFFRNSVRVHASSKDLERVICSEVKDLGGCVQVLRGEHADLDADGWSDVLVTALTADMTSGSRAAAYFHSSRNGARLGVLEREVVANDYGAIASTNATWIAVSSPLEDGGAGRVRIWSADGRERHLQFRGGEGIRHLGARLAWVGEHELAMSAPWTSEARGIVLVYDVRSGRLIRSWSGDVPHACFGLALDGGARDLVVGAPGDVCDPAAPGTVEVLSVSSGRRLLRIVGPPTKRLPWDESFLDPDPRVPQNLDAPLSDSFGYAVAAANLDGDELADLVIGHPCRGPDDLVGEIHALSGVELRRCMRGAP
jgi:hypothetical protein